jgi:hypothetical protein
MNVKTLTAAVTMALAGCATKAPAPTPAAAEDAPDPLAPPRAQPTTYGERMVRSLWTQSVSRAMGLEPEELDELDWPCALRWGGERAGDPAPLEVSYDAGVVTRVRASGAFEGGVPSGLYQYTHAQGDTLVEVLFCADGRERCDDGERSTTRVVRRGEGELWLRRTSWDGGEVSSVFDQVVTFGGDDPLVVASRAGMTLDGDAPVDGPMELGEPDEMRWDEGWRTLEHEGIARDEQGRLASVSWGPPSLRTVKEYTYGDRGEISAVAMTRNGAPLKAWSYTYSAERPARIERIARSDGTTLVADYSCHETN